MKINKNVHARTHTHTHFQFFLFLNKKWFAVYVIFGFLEARAFGPRSQMKNIYLFMHAKTNKESVKN